ncbi:MAG: tol-pal system protein YbgF [Polyangiales bacterium]
MAGACMHAPQSVTSMPSKPEIATYDEIIGSMSGTTSVPSVVVSEERPLDTELSIEPPSQSVQTPRERSARRDVVRNDRPRIESSYDDVSDITLTNTQSSMAMDVIIHDSIEDRSTDRDAEHQYARALHYIERGSFSTAEAQLNEFLNTYPEHTLRSNAAYWIAEMAYLQKDNQRAERAFESYLRAYPNATKTSEALYKIVKIYNANGRHEAANRARKRLLKEFPNTAAARLAQEENAS